MFKIIVDYFIPSQLDKSPEYQRRMRLVTYAIVVTMAFALFYVTTSWVAGYFTGLFIMLGSWIFYLGLLFLLKRGLNVFKVANIFGLIGIISIYGSIYFSGGFESPVLPWLASTPIVLLLIAGKKSGYFWAIAAVFIVLSFSLMDSAGFKFPRDYDPSKEAYFKLSCQTGLVLIIFFISFVFENLRFNAFSKVTQQKDALESTLSELKSTQSQLIQSEKMASLGQLIAGIAHEINTPIGAINASIASISDSISQSIKFLPDLVKSLSENELKLFMELVSRSADSNNIITSKEEREIRRKIASELEKIGIAEADDFADILVDIGIYNDVETYFPLFKPQTMQAAYHLSMQIKNSQNIKMAVDRVAKIVFALKNYARYGSEESMVEANIVDGLETVLTLYQNQFKHGITLHKAFVEVPPVLCYPDELNQVWTNLIHNAIHAMEGKGELSISVSINPKGFQNLWGLEVRITDTGKGIPPEFKDRIFDAFFTTKAAGEGSGLGLHIVKQIIDKHGGTISFESEIGKGTSFIVNLYINQ